MILTICANPSIDCTIELDALNVGMLNRIRNKEETYSGKGLNVAKGIARLGAKCFATGFMFAEHENTFKHVLDKEGIENQFIVNQGSCRVNYKIIDKRSMLTEINDIGGEVSRENQLKLIELIKEKSKNCNIAVMSGSLPRGVSAEFYYEALSVIPENVKIIVDTETDNMLSALKRGVFMVKPNLRELENFSQMTVRTRLDGVKAAKKYIEKGVQYVLLSLGEDGAILTDGTKHYYCRSASVAVNSRVGAGDCMVAAACVCLEQGKTLQELLRSSVAAGTASITTSGTNLFYKDKFDEIYDKIYVEELFEE